MNYSVEAKRSFSILKPHIIFWTLYITYEIGVVYSVAGALAPLRNFVFAYILNISLFYVHAFMVSKSTRNDKPVYFKIILLTLTEVVGYLAVKYVLVKALIFLHVFTANDYEGFSRFIVNGSWRAISYIFISSAYAFGRLSAASLKRISTLDKQMLTNQLNKEKLEKNLLATENAFLKAQINPHFLFNTLSFIHSNVIKYSESLGEVVVTLADMMRYAFSENTSDGMVPLSAEVEQIENYIYLNQQRFSHQLQIKFEVDNSLSKIRIVPLLLMTLVENVFKYGLLSDSEQPAEILLFREDDQLCLLVANAKSPRIHQYSNGIGMANVEKRLEQFYPGKYDLKVYQDDLTYKLTLKINISNDYLLHH